MEDQTITVVMRLEDEEGRAIVTDEDTLRRIINEELNKRAYPYYPVPQYPTAPWNPTGPFKWTVNGTEFGID